MLCPSCRAENPAGATLCRLCGRALEELVAGTLFASRYEILAPLGRGGMGAVFKAVDRELDEVVVLLVSTRPVGRSQRDSSAARASAAAAAPESPAASASRPASRTTRRDLAA